MTRESPPSGVHRQVQTSLAAPVAPLVTRGHSVAGAGPGPDARPRKRANLDCVSGRRPPAARRPPRRSPAPRIRLPEVATDPR
ncbi:hypothetical protein EVAR_36556_1 [Eumeta japonica]|uniref:Uncharacterized protein n=1 Tax=Eumeta variegata TaxID=151549 RepID=A0A4C1Y1D8_EUMVA|nr:hypothetical protein EVAR_36556_1 [Eumeta japonica]